MEVGLSPPAMARSVVDLRWGGIPNFSMSAKSPSLFEFLEDYALAHPGLGTDSLRQMEMAVRLLDRWAERSLTLYDLSEGLLRRFMADYGGRVRPATVNAKLRSLLAIWRFAYDEELVDRPPRRVRRMPEELAEPEAWTLDEIERIVSAARRQPGEVAGLAAGAWWVSLLLVAYVTGERRGALMRVQCQNLDLAGRSILFARTKQRRARRRALSDQAVAACAAIWCPHRELLWPWPFSREWFDASLRKILRRAEVSFGRGRGGLMHKFRRTSGSMVEAAGGDGSRHLGNSRRVFERHYAAPRLVGDPTSRHVPKLRDEEGPMWVI